MSSANAGKPMTIKYARRDGKLIHDEPTYTLCPACWHPTPHGGYCSPEHEAAHKRLAQ